MELDPFQKDALAEFGNIGAAHAATSLSQMLMSPIEMTVPEVQAIDIANLHNYINNEITAMVVFQIQGGRSQTVDTSSSACPGRPSSS